MTYKKIVSVVLAFALLFSITSCGSAPAEEKADNVSAAAVNNKTENNVTEEKAEDVTAEEEPKEGTFVNKDGTVRQVTVHEGADGIVTYYIDAEVLGKDAVDLPIIEVTHDYFDSDELKAIILPFIGDNILYEKYSEWDRGDYSRTYESDYEYHPEEYYKSVYFENNPYWEPKADWYEFNALSIVDGLPRTFNSSRHEGINNFVIGYYSMGPAVRDMPFLQTNNFSDEDIENAVVDVREYLDSAGFEDWQLRSYKVENVGAGKFELDMDFIPTYHGTPMLFAAEKSGSYHWEFDVEQDWQYHELEVSYSKGEIVSLFVRSPIDVVSETPQTLISYDEAIAAVCRELEASYTAEKMQASYDEKLPSSQNTVLSWNVYVDKLELVYVRVPVADNPGHYYLIPTWVAYGGHGIDEQIRNNTVVTVGNRHSGNGEPIAFINAIDGTPIDFENGY